LSLPHTLADTLVDGLDQVEDGHQDGRDR